MDEQPANDMEMEVRRAASHRDPVGALAALGRHGLLEKLDRHIGRRFGRFDTEEVRWVVATTADALYERLAEGHEIKKISSWAYKTAENKATVVAEAKKNYVPLEKWDGQAEEIDPLETEEDRDKRREEAEAARAERIRQLLQVAKRLVPRISGARPRQVMSIIFEAMEKGVTDLSNEDIGDILGMKKGNVAVAKHRAFEYLTELAKEEGMASIEFDVTDLDLADEAAALAAGDEEEDDL